MGIMVKGGRTGKKVMRRFIQLAATREDGIYNTINGYPIRVLRFLKYIKNNKSCSREVGVPINKGRKIRVTPC